MSTPDRGRRLAAVLFADIVGYTRLSSEDEVAALELVETLHSVSRECAERAGGRVVKFIGDAAMAEFPSTEAAVRCAIELQNEYVGRARATGYPSQLRVGVHVGDVTPSPDGDLHGDGVNIAARIQSAAEPGQVLVSEDVWRQLRSRRELEFMAEGERELKGISMRVGVFSAGTAGSTPLPLQSSEGAAVVQQAEPAVAIPIAPTPAPVPARPRRTGVLLLGLGAAALLALLAALYLPRRGEPEPSLPTAQAAMPADSAVPDSTALDSAARPETRPVAATRAREEAAEPVPSTATTTTSAQTRRAAARTLEEQRLRRRAAERRRRRLP
jgi:adenylate cyclase